MSNKRMTIVLNRDLSTLCTANICSPTYFEMANCMKVAILDIVTFEPRTLDLNFEASFAEHDGLFVQFSASNGVLSYFHEL